VLCFLIIILVVKMYVINPKTGRRVKVGGKTHKQMSLAKNRPSTRRSKQIKKSKSGKGSGSRTRGWAAVAPQRGKERTKLSQKCGSKCFLIPKEKKFPICGSLRTTGGKCNVSCRGLLSAKIRASQYKYKGVAQKATKLMKTHQC